MLQRLFTLVLAVIVGATPIAGEMCRAFCAAHRAASTSSHPHHDEGHAISLGGQTLGSDHHLPRHSIGVPDRSGIPSGELSVRAAAHGCSYGAELQAVSAPATKVLKTSAVVPRVVGPVSPAVADVPFGAGNGRPPGPIPIARRTPLRI
jgi:hypothetical protein